VNIALLIDTLAGGGAEGVLRRLAAGLARRGQRVFVYCLKHAETPTEHLRAAGVVVREARAVGRSPLLAWRLARWLRSDRVEIVHAHSCAALAWAFPAAKLLGLPLVHVRHGWPLGGPSRYGRLANYLDPLVERVVINCASARERLPRGRVTRTAVHIPNGIDLQPVALQDARTRLEELCGRSLRGPVILSVANIRVEKDICGLLRAFALLRRQRPDAALVCVGAIRDRAYWAEVQRELQNLGLTDHALFPGPVEDAWQLMPAADVLCLSSRTEGMPNVVLEAMAQSVPVVATAVGDVGRLDTHADPRHFLLRHNQTGVLVPPGNPPALATALRYALRDRSAARRRAARAAEDHARWYTTDRMVQRYERLYADCLRPRPNVSRADRATICRRRPGVLMVGPAAPQIGGMVSAIDGLMTSPLREAYDLHRFATTADRQGFILSRAGRPHSPPTGRDPAPARGRLRGRDARTPRRWALKFASVTRHLAALLRLGQVLIRRAGRPHYPHERIALVHIHTCSYFTFYRNLLDLALIKLLGRKAVLHIRGGRFAQFCADSGIAGRWLIRRGCELADAVVVLSPSWRARLSPFVGQARVLVIPNGVALPAHEPQTREGKDDPSAALGTSLCPYPRPSTGGGSAGRQPCRFLFLGPLTEPKGLGDLIEAASLLERGDIPFHLLIAGPAPPTDRSAWEQRIAQAGLAQRVTFHGPVQGAEKTRLLASADCLVHPSHSEGLPFTILEAAAAGLPVIATAVGAVPDVLTPRPPGRSRFRAGGTPALPEERLAPLVPPHDPATLARELTRLALDEPLRRRIGQALRSHVAASYNVDQQVRRVARLYESVLPRRFARRRPGNEPRTSVCAPAPARLGPAAHTRNPSSEHRSPDADRPEPTAIATRH